MIKNYSKLVFEKLDFEESNKVFLAESGTPGEPTGPMASAPTYSKGSTAGWF